MIAFDETPVNKLLGMQLVQSDLEYGKVSLEDSSAWTQEGGVVHGGILSTLADTAAVYSVMPHLAVGDSLTSIEFKMNFFRPARPGRGAICATAKVLKGGRRIYVCESTLVQDDAELAKGTFTYLVLA